MVAPGTNINETYINLIISAIQAEKTRRVVSANSSVTKVDGEEVTPDNGLRTDLTAINAKHCYCESDANLEGHAGGVPISLQSPVRNPGDQVLASDIDKFESDRVVLSGQCNCHSVGPGDLVCNCESVLQGVYCTCNSVCGGVCTSVQLCPSFICYTHVWAVGYVCYSVSNTYSGGTYGTTYTCGCDSECQCEFGG